MKFTECAAPNGDALAIRVATAETAIDANMLVADRQYWQQIIDVADNNLDVTTHDHILQMTDDVDFTLQALSAKHSGEVIEEPQTFMRQERQRLLGFMALTRLHQGLASSGKFDAAQAMQRKELLLDVSTDEYGNTDDVRIHLQRGLAESLVGELPVYADQWCKTGELYVNVKAPAEASEMLSSDLQLQAAPANFLEMVSLLPYLPTSSAA